ncbi:ATP synthase subunit s, mitochondrial-like isoform X1 [Oratosquilla oratoria]|uniref:ATP synthase subunit s, mitochondrial-like isoform X1 n=1 Tax=Oratosquilla oratoria TaxID=337810 RepID=UPI003F776BAC
MSLLHMRRKLVMPASRLVYLTNQYFPHNPSFQHSPSKWHLGSFHSIHTLSKNPRNWSRPQYFEPSRKLWGWLNFIFNKVDENRIKEVGPDRACAEWLLRCGAGVKWLNYGSWTKDYNSLPIGGAKMHKIEEIDGTDSAVIVGVPLWQWLKVAEGEQLLAVRYPCVKNHQLKLILSLAMYRPASPDGEGCKHIRRIIFHKTSYLDDAALAYIPYLKGSLKELQISSCGNITVEGLQHLKKLEGLEYLLLYDLPEIKDRKAMEDELQKALPNCAVVFPYADAKDDPSLKKEDS